MILNFLSLYLPTTPYIFIYMLQQVEYDPVLFINWANRLPNYTKVMRRQKLVLSRKALLLVVLAYLMWLGGICLSVYIVLKINVYLGLLLSVWLPFLTILSLSLLIWLAGKVLNVKRSKDIKQAAERLANHKAIKIAVIGSYGKTTTKEIVKAALSESKIVAATPGNKNVLISHARWINNLDGHEEILIFEFGEYRPGDISAMARLVKPDYAIITGYAPNHIDTYGSVEALKKDLKSISKFVDEDNIFASSQAAKELGIKEFYSSSRAGSYKVSSVENSLTGISFKLVDGKKKLELRSQLVGRHLIGPLAMAAVLALRIGIKNEEIKAGIQKTMPYEHRLKPININGAWIIDDTYNGNLEGIKVGLELLSELKSRRKIYVTPGLVEQGDQKEAVHKLIAQYIMESKLDEVVLMKNSATKIIHDELNRLGYNSETIIVDDALNYYENIQYGLAAGDIVLMQNDWTDNYY